MVPSMTVATLPPLTDAQPRLPVTAAQLERVEGAAQIVAGYADGRTRLEGLRQSGAAKIRLPRVTATTPLEAVLLNTAGGVTGGDRLSYAAVAKDNARLLVTSQAAERAYRSADGVAEIGAHLDVAGNARLDWIPQETILFEGSRLKRRLVADIAATATLLVAESVVLGRVAMGEVLHDTRFTDNWRIRRDGRMVFADGTRLDGDGDAIMGRRATGGSAKAFATVLLVAPHAETRLDDTRAALGEANSEWGVSAWNGMLVARILATGGQALRAALVALIETLRGTPMPRVWNC